MHRKITLLLLATTLGTASLANAQQHAGKENNGGGRQAGQPGGGGGHSGGGHASEQSHTQPQNRPDMGNHHMPPPAVVTPARPVPNYGYNRPPANYGSNRPDGNYTHNRPPPGNYWRPEPGRPQANYWQNGHWNQHPVYAPVYRYPRGYSYRRWSPGLVLPSAFFGSAFLFEHYLDIGLPSPPYGYHWVRYGPDLLLVNNRTGRIRDVRYGVFG